MNERKKKGSKRERLLSKSRDAKKIKKLKNKPNNKTLFIFGRLTALSAAWLASRAKPPTRKPGVPAASYAPPEAWLRL